jgi:hypothetical protein
MRASLRCTTATVEGTHMLKEVRFGKHTVMCDEGPMIGGDDAYPPPIAYMAGAGSGQTLRTPTWTWLKWSGTFHRIWNR